jgi:integrase
MRKGTGVYQRKESPYWWGWVTLNGNKKEFSTKQRLKREAEKVVYEKYQQLVQGLPIENEKHGKTVKNVIDDYLAAYKSSPNKNYGDVKCLIKRSAYKIFGHKKINELKDKDILDYVSTRRNQDISDGTIQLELSYLKAALRRGSKNKTAINELFTPVFASKGVDRLKPNKNQHQFRHQDYLNFIKVCPPWLRLMIKIAYRNPVRSKELRDLKFSKIDLHTKQIRLEHTKTDAPRVLRIEGDLYKELKSWCDAAKDENGDYVREFVFVTEKRPKSKIAETTFFANYAHYAKKAGLYRDGERLTYHRLRATSASNMDRAGVSHKIIMAIGGWESYETLKRYLGRATPEDHKNAGIKMEEFYNSLEN